MRVYPSPSLEGFEVRHADEHDPAGQICVFVCSSVTLNPLGPLSDRARDGHVWPQAGSDPQLAVVGELDLAVLQAALFSKSPYDLRFRLSTLLTGSHGLRCSCAPHVPSRPLACARQSRRFYRRSRYEWTFRPRGGESSSAVTSFCLLLGMASACADLLKRWPCAYILYMPKGWAGLPRSGPVASVWDRRCRACAGGHLGALRTSGGLARTS